MTSSDESQDRELLERYARASRAEPLAPSAAVRAAILAEAQRVAGSVSVRAVPIEPERRRTRWKMTAWGAAAAALLAALTIAPRLYPPAPEPVASTSVAKKTLGVEPEAEPRPVVPMVPVPSPPTESLAPRLVNDTPTMRRSAAAAPPVHVPEQSVEIAPLSLAQSQALVAAQQAQHAQEAQLASRAQARAVNPRDAGDDDNNAAINHRDASGRTPLMLAIGENKIDAVRLLLNRGADPNGEDAQGMTPLQLARQGKFDDIADLLISAGAH